jgi:glycosyltransferase involved in cell wall biosynthesis
LTSTDLRTPCVSIGVPVYNGAQYLAKALDSLLEQTFADFEIVICDNASTDGTEAICREYVRRDPRVRYHRNAVNLGIAGNYARALELASGKYFKFAAHDDLCAPQFLERCVDILDRRPDVVLSYPKTMILDEVSGQTTAYEDRQDLQSPLASERFRQLLRNLTLCNTIFGLTRTAVLRKTAGLPKYPGADIVLMAELCLHGKFQEVPEYLFYRRFHPSASSGIKDKKQLELYLEPAVARQQRPALREWHHFFGHLRSSFRAPVGTVERVRLLLFLLHISYWKRKKLIKEFGEIVHRSWGKLGMLFKKGVASRLLQV